MSSANSEWKNVSLSGDAEAEKESPSSGDSSKAAPKKVEASEAAASGASAAAQAAAMPELNDPLSQVKNVMNTVFVGRVPKTTNPADIYHAFRCPQLAASATGPGSSPSPAAASAVVYTIAKIVPSRATYLFVEYETPEACDVAVKFLNGLWLNGSRIVVQPATSLRKLFIGNLRKDSSPSAIHTAIDNLAGEGLVSVELFEDEASTSMIQAALGSGDSPTEGASGGNPGFRSSYSLGASYEDEEGNSAATSGSASSPSGAAAATSGAAASGASAEEGASSPSTASPAAPAATPAAAPSSAAPSPAPSAPAPSSSSSSNAPIAVSPTTGSVLHAPSPGCLHRGFCFAEFADHADAHKALKKLLAAGAAALPSATDGTELKVDWAEPLHEVPSVVMSMVRVAYVSNLPPLPDAGEAYLHGIFSRFGPVERVKRMRSFAFVHFRERNHAEAAIKTLHNTVIAGHAIKVQWSKPPPRPAQAPGILSPAPNGPSGSGHGNGGNMGGNWNNNHGGNHGSGHMGHGGNRGNRGHYNNHNGGYNNHHNNNHGNGGGYNGRGPMNNGPRYNNNNNNNGGNNNMGNEGGYSGRGNYNNNNNNMGGGNMRRYNNNHHNNGGYNNHNNSGNNNSGNNNGFNYNEGGNGFNEGGFNNGGNGGFNNGYGNGMGRGGDGEMSGNGGFLNQGGYGGNGGGYGEDNFDSFNGGRGNGRGPKYMNNNSQQQQRKPVQPGQQYGAFPGAPVYGMEGGQDPAFVLPVMHEMSGFPSALGMGGVTSQPVWGMGPADISGYVAHPPDPSMALGNLSLGANNRQMPAENMNGGLGGDDVSSALWTFSRLGVREGDAA